jgi:hypothetical protein
LEETVMVTKTVVRKKRSAKAATPMDKIAREVGRAGDRLSQGADEVSVEARHQALKLLLSVIDIQKTALDHSIAVLAQAQDASAHAVTRLVKDAGWMPAEGKDVVKAWVKLLLHSRQEFQKTVDKSFDLLTDYLERVDGARNGKAAAPKPRKPAKARARAAAH